MGDILFLSYSREDSQLIVSLAKLLRTATTAPVFLDQDSIKPGELWQDVIAESIQRATQVYVFWCEHAAGSTWVRQEFQRAIELGKPIIPVVLDRTVLPKELALYQTLDISGTSGHAIRTTPIRRRGCVLLLVVAGMLTASVVALPAAGLSDPTSTVWIAVILGATLSLVLVLAFYGVRWQARVMTRRKRTGYAAQRILAHAKTVEASRGSAGAYG